MRQVYSLLGSVLDLPKVSPSSAVGAQVTPAGPPPGAVYWRSGSAFCNHECSDGHQGDERAG